MMTMSIDMTMKKHIFYMKNNFLQMFPFCPPQKREEEVKNIVILSSYHWNGVPKLVKVSLLQNKMQHL